MDASPTKKIKNIEECVTKYGSLILPELDDLEVMTTYDDSDEDIKTKAKGEIGRKRTKRYDSQVMNNKKCYTKPENYAKVSSNDSEFDWTSLTEGARESFEQLPVVQLAKGKKPLSQKMKEDSSAMEMLRETKDKKDGRLDDGPKKVPNKQSNKKLSLPSYKQLEQLTDVAKFQKSVITKNKLSPHQPDRTVTFNSNFSKHRPDHNSNTIRKSSTAQTSQNQFHRHISEHSTMNGTEAQVKKTRLD